MNREPDDMNNVVESIRMLSIRPKSKQPIEIIRNSTKPVTIAGPMVRYSKLPFRELVRFYNVDLVYTPMILAREFVRNKVARYSDFTTNIRDTPTIVQIGCNNSVDLLRMVDMIHSYVDGISLNCGCPIKEQVREGIGAALMTEPEKVSQMVRVVKEKYGDSVCIETKIRIHNDIQETIRFVEQVQDAGVDYITVHGRTKTTRSSKPVDLESIRIIKEVAKVPVIANGDCVDVKSFEHILDVTKCDGVMSVRGLLENPSLFSGYNKTNWGCVERFFSLSMHYGLPFRIIQHHLSCMTSQIFTKKEHLQLNQCNNMIELLDFFDRNFELKRMGENGFGEDVDVRRRHPEGIVGT
ncbi:hypothetical protein LJB42_000749 [Komagataella kurtzmanii]|nr:hypothetical protein LJB42_000749 [Komagataella kurtzmanii]